MSRLRVALLLISLVAVLGCPSGSGRPDPVGQNSSAASDAAIEASPVFPILIETAGLGAESDVQSAYLDKLCERIPMSDELTALRPDGKGCPRQTSNADASVWGAN